MHLEEEVSFTGLLNDEEMKREYLKANVFVCPSSIENSPNSLGEAQLLGTPCIAAYVGGVPDMVQHGKTGYINRFEDTVMLASCICQVFEMEVNIEHISCNGVKDAMDRHDGKKNNERLIEIYKGIAYGNI